LLADICLCNAVFYGGLALVLAITVAVGTAVFMVFFAKTAGPGAYLRVADKVPIDVYMKRERIWIWISLAIAILFLAIATWYNLAVRLPAGP
jgi:hypothetical protein